AAGRAEGPIEGASITLQRDGADTSTLLLATLAPRRATAAPAPAATPPAPVQAPPVSPPALEAPQPPTRPPEISPPRPEPAAPAPMLPAQTITPQPPAAPAVSERRAPLRFVWQLDGGGSFSISSDEFLALIGNGPAAVLGRPWS